MGHCENHTTARYSLLEFYRRLRTVPDVDRVCSRTGCSHWFCLCLVLHGPTPFLPHDRRRNQYARLRLPTKGLDSGEISGCSEKQSWHSQNLKSIHTPRRETRLGGCSKSPSSKAAASEGPRRTLAVR